MKIKIFCRCSLFPSWSGSGIISTLVMAIRKAMIDCTVQLKLLLLVKWITGSYIRLTVH
jgi:hypothetical protein